MKIVKLQLPKKFVHILGLANMFKDVERLEIVNAYQYDKKNFFSIQRIFYNQKLAESLTDNEFIKVIKKKFHATHFELMNRNKNIILCTMKQNRNKGFWRTIESGPWAFLFPLIVQKDSILVTVLTKVEYIKKLTSSINLIMGAKNKFTVLSQNSVKDLNDLGICNLTYPEFSDRQKQISSFAAENGYFESPKKITAKEIAEHFKISVSAINENLRKAEQLAMRYFFGNKTLQI